MPNVPRRDRVAATAPLPGVRVSPDAPAAAFRPVEPIDISGVTRAIADFAAREREKADQLALLDADNRLAKLHTDLELEARQRRGKDALSATADIEAKWQEGVGVIEKELGNNDRVRFAFHNRAGNRWQSLYANVERHAAVETERYDNEVTDTALKNRVNDALTNFRDPEMVAKAAVELRAIVRDHGKRQGWAPEAIEQRTNEQLSRLHAGVISRFLHAGDDRAARAYYQKAKGQILGEHAENIDQALQEGSTLGEAQRQADAIIKTKGITRTEAYERARAIDDPKVRRATEQQLDTEYARQDRLEREQHDQFLKTAAEYADGGQQAPATILSRLSVAERRSLESYRRSVVRGEPIETDWAAYYQLKQQAGNPRTRAEFMRLNLLTYRDRLANSEFEELVKLQTNVSRTGDQATRGFMTDLQIVNTTIDQAGLFPKAGKVGGQKDDAARAEFVRAIDLDVQQEKQRTGKETLPSDVVQKIADAHVLRRAFARGELGTDDRDNAQFQFLTADRQGRPFVPTESIPEAERNKLAAYLRRLGYTVSTSKLERLYGAAILRVPQQTFDEIAREP